MRILQLFLIVVTLLISAVIGEKNDISFEIGELASKISSLSMSSLKNFDNSTYVAEFKKLFEKYCKPKSDSDNYWEEALKSREQLEKCLNQNVNVNELKERMEIAKPKGDLDEVFRDICQKNVPNVMECALDFMQNLEPCFDNNYATVKKYYVNITESIADLLCKQDGKFIVLFIAEQGPECLVEQQKDIQRCLNDRFFKNLQAEASAGGPNSYASTAVSVLHQVQNCSALNVFSECFVGNLKNCQRNFVPANIVDAIFTKLFKITQCKRDKDQMTN